MPISTCHYILSLAPKHELPSTVHPCMHCALICTSLFLTFEYSMHCALICPSRSNRAHASKRTRNSRQGRLPGTLDWPIGPVTAGKAGSLARWTGPLALSGCTGPWQAWPCLGPGKAGWTCRQGKSGWTCPGTLDWPMHVGVHKVIVTSVSPTHYANY